MSTRSLSLLPFGFLEVGGVQMEWVTWIQVCRALLELRVRAVSVQSKGGSCVDLSKRLGLGLVLDLVTWLKEKK
jgi:hypothetical protein